MSRAEKTIVTVRVTWGDYVVGVHDVRKGETLRLPELDGWELVRFAGAEATLQLPATLDGGERALTVGSTETLSVGELSLSLSCWTSPRVFRPGWHWPTTEIVGLFFGLLFAVALFAVAFMGGRTKTSHAISTPPLLAGSGPPATWASLGAALDEPVKPPLKLILRLVEEPQAELFTLPGTLRCGEAEMGSPGEPDVDERYAVAGPPDNPNPYLSRHTDVTQKRIIGGTSVGPTAMGSSVTHTEGPHAPWGRNDSLGSDEVFATGRMWGDMIGAAKGDKHLGMRGWSAGLAKRLEIAPSLASSHRVVQPGFKVTGARPPSQVGRALQAHFDGLRTCVDQARLGDNQRVELGFDVDARGGLSSVLIETPAGAPESLRTCLSSHLAEVEFPTAASGSTHVEYPLLSLGAPAEPAARPIPTDTTVSCGCG